MTKETKTYSQEQLKDGEFMAKFLNSATKENRQTAVMVINSFIAGLEAGKDLVRKEMA